MWKHSVLHLSFFIFLRFVSCCQCNLNKKDTGVDKRELELEEATTTEFIDRTRTNTDPGEIFTTTNIPQTSFFETNETTTESDEKIKGLLFEIETNKSHIIPNEHNSLDIFELNENSSEIVEAIVDNPENNLESNYLGTADPNDTTTESVIDMKTGNESHNDFWKKCQHYRNGDSFNLGKMSDIWQVVYYRLPTTLKCFKLHIKALKIKDQRRYLRVFGSFNDTVRWNHCFLEVTSSEEQSGRRHFLQGTQSDKGVMQNVLIDEEYFHNTTYLTLRRESGDQWLVIDNLLVMRDCENGDFVVFTRFPEQPREIEIMNALKMFGENEPNGTMACNIERSWLKYNEDVHSLDEPLDK